MKEGRGWRGMDEEGKRSNEKLRGERDKKKERIEILIIFYINIGRCTEKIILPRIFGLPIHHQAILYHRLS